MTTEKINIVCAKCGSDNVCRNDLVLMPDIELLDDAQIKMVDNADWFEAEGVLLVSAKQIDYLSEDDPLDAGINISKAEITHVSPVLHRWNKVDGFYHA